MVYRGKIQFDVLTTKLEGVREAKLQVFVNGYHVVFEKSFPLTKDYGFTVKYKIPPRAMLGRKRIVVELGTSQSPETNIEKTFVVDNFALSFQTWKWTGVNRLASCWMRETPKYLKDPTNRFLLAILGFGLILLAFALSAVALVLWAMVTWVKSNFYHKRAHFNIRSTLHFMLAILEFGLILFALTLSVITIVLWATVTWVVFYHEEPAHISSSAPPSDDPLQAS